MESAHTIAQVRNALTHLANNKIIRRKASEDPNHRDPDAAPKTDVPHGQATSGLLAVKKEIVTAPKLDYYYIDYKQVLYNCFCCWIAAIIVNGMLMFLS